MAKRSRLYRIWGTMKDRCLNSNYRDYPRYGGRGITVCEEWRDSFGAFESWALKKGYDANQPDGRKAGLSLERKKNDGPYSPDNCTWVNRKQQMRNTRNNHPVTAFGETKLISDWPNDPRCVVPRLTLRRRLATGVPPEEALTFPKQKGGGALRPGGNKLVDIIRRHNHPKAG